MAKKTSSAIAAPADRRETGTKAPNIADIPMGDRSRARAESGLVDAAQLSIDKHCVNIRSKIAYSADQLANELAVAVSSRSKKDKEYIKGLVWSLGVLFDKLAGGATEAVTVRIPSKLLDNVKVIIAAQAERKAKPIDITPQPLDTESGAQLDKSST